MNISRILAFLLAVAMWGGCSRTVKETPFVNKFDPVEALGRVAEKHNWQLLGGDGGTAYGAPNVKIRDLAITMVVPEEERAKLMAEFRQEVELAITESGLTVSGRGLGQVPDFHFQYHSSNTEGDVRVFLVAMAEDRVRIILVIHEYLSAR